MKREKLLYSITCAIGGVLIGLFASRLNTILGGFLFTFGVFIMVYSIIHLNK